MRNKTIDVPSLLMPNSKYARGDKPDNPPDEPPDDPPGNNPPRTNKDLCIYIQNWGPGGKAADFAEVIEQFNPHAVAMCEAGDQRAQIRRLKERVNYRLLDGIGLPGQASTPLLWNPRLLDIIRPVNFLIHPDAQIKTNNGGHMRMKDKYYIGGHFRMEQSRNKFYLGSIHWVYNQDMEPNGRIGQKSQENFIRHSRDYTNDLFMAAGDWNMKLDGPRATKLHNAGFHSARAKVDINSAHGEIDDLAYRFGKPSEQRGNRFRVKKGRAVRNSSDHDGIIIWGEIV